MYAYIDDKRQAYFIVSDRESDCEWKLLFVHDYDEIAKGNLRIAIKIAQ